MHFPHQHRSWYFTSFHQGNWKLIYHYRPNRKQPWDRIELFDLPVDPSEANNLAGKNPEKLEAMFGAMSAALERSGAQFPLADDKRSALKPSLTE